MRIPAFHPKAELRSHPTNNTRWIARDLDDPEVFWEWFRGVNGWEDRVPYTDPEGFNSLESRPAWEAFHSGWPGAQPAPRKIHSPRPPRRSVPVRVMVTMVEAARIYDRAGREEKTVSSWARDIILDAIREDAHHE